MNTNMNMNMNIKMNRFDHILLALGCIVAGMLAIGLHSVRAMAILSALGIVVMAVAFCIMSE